MHASNWPPTPVEYVYIAINSVVLKTTASGVVMRPVAQVLRMPMSLKNC